MSRFTPQEEALIRFGRRLAPEMRAELAQTHAALGSLCNAHDEGQYCCVDFILGDVKGASDVAGG